MKLRPLVMVYHGISWLLSLASTPYVGGEVCTFVHTETVEIH